VRTVAIGGRAIPSFQHFSPLYIPFSKHVRLDRRYYGFLQVPGDDDMDGA
jgi:hypothetical protein